MRVGIHATNRGHAPADIVRRCRDIGADGACLGCNMIRGFEENGVPDLDHLREMLGQLRGEGLYVPTMMGARFSDAMFFEETEGEKERAALYGTLERLGQAGVRSMLFWATPARSEDENEYREQLAKVTEFYRKLGDHCDEVGVNIASHPWVSRPGVFHGFRAYRQMCDVIPTKRIGINFCPGGGLAGDDMAQIIDDFEGRIHFAHLRDQIGTWENFEEVFLGEGEYEVAALLRKLQGTGYDGIICPEHLGTPEPGEDREARAVAFIQEVLKGE